MDAAAMYTEMDRNTLTFVISAFGCTITFYFCSNSSGVYT